MVELADSGKPYIYFRKESKVSGIFEEIIQKTLDFLQ
jgi:hypothetical protein